MFIFFDDPSVIVQQVPPQIQVNVEMPPGMPEWVKIVVSAAVGAAFGIIASLSTEFVKPWISKHHARKNMIPQLNEELINNLIQFENALKVLGENEPARHKRVLFANVLLQTLVRSDRFNYYFENEKNLVYGYDKDLITIYRTLSTIIPVVVVNENDAGFETLVNSVAETARAFVLRHNLKVELPQKK